MPPKIRIELLLPTHYNPDEQGNRESVELRKFRLVKNEIVDKFKALSVHPYTIKGTWVNPKNGKVFYDECYKYEVVINYREGIEEELSKWKERLKELFVQFEIFMTFCDIYQV